jgi:hypothetical protein
MKKHVLASASFVLSAFCVFTGVALWGEPANAKSIDDLTVAVRSPKITEVEFQARAISYGVVPVGKVLADRTHQRPEKLQALQTKLVSAQLEWIVLESLNSRDPSINIGTENIAKSNEYAAIDALLEMEYENEWDEEAQNIFLEFLVRKATLIRLRNTRYDEPQVAPLLMRIAQQIKQRPVLTVASDTQQAAVFLEAQKLAEKFMPNTQSFENLPSDIFGVLVGGVWYPRSQDHFVIYFPDSAKQLSHEKTKVRLTFISNLFQPKTLILEGPQSFYDLGSRLPLLNTNNPCSTNLASFLTTEAPAVVLGEATCEAMIGVGGFKTLPTSLKQINDFGRGNIPRDPFSSVPPMEQPRVVRPWVWAAIGSFAILAAVISSRSKETHLQPTTTAGW